MKTHNVAYLACPYTHSDPAIRERRFQAANQAAAHLIRQGRVIFSPISMTHPIDIILGVDGSTLGSEFWVSFDEAFMEGCSEIIVLTLEGWDDSAGVQREIEFFTERELKVSYLDPASLQAE